VRKNQFLVSVDSNHQGLQNRLIEPGEEVGRSAAHGSATGNGVSHPSNALSAGRSFVQKLYNDVLGRTG
jgi:hypothetical protein